MIPDENFSSSCSKQGAMERQKIVICIYACNDSRVVSEAEHFLEIGLGNDWVEITL